MEPQSASSSYNGSGSEDEDRLHAYLNDPLVPSDAKMMATFLHTHGITDHEPKVINQLLDFMHRTIITM